MTYREFPADSMIASVTYHPERFLEPIRDQLKAWKEASHTERRPWKNHEVQVRDGKVCIDGYEVHDHVLWRLGSYLLGVKKNRWDWWLANPDLLIDALQRGGPFQPDEEVEVRVIDGQVVYATNLGVDLGHHLDFFDPIMQKVTRSADASSTPVGLLGYCIDPVWTHVNLVWLPEGMRTHQVGLRVDVNYRFSRDLRGRAYASFFGYDLYWESALNLDTWWSVRTKELNRTADDLVPNFARRVDRGMKGLRPKARGALQKLTTLRGKTARKDWRQAMYVSFASQFQKGPLRDATLRFAESGKTSVLDYGFALSRALSHYPYERRLVGERKIANKLKEVK